MEIHELNTFTGTPGEVDFLVTDNGTDTSKISAKNLLKGPNDKITDLQSKKINQPLDAYNQPTNGADGQLLRTKGNGKTEWANVGLPTDAQTAQAVSDWLDAHPEATTTVLDGSLTYSKLVNGTLGFVIPQMYGAKADGVTDDTASIQAAINSGKTVFVPNGTYIVDPDVGLQIRSGTRMILGPNAIIQASASSSDTYYIVYILECDDVVISGGKIVGEKDIHAGAGGEWGHGINIETSNNVLIENIEISNCWGDGIYVGSKFVDNDHIGAYRSTNVTIRNVNIHDCRRNGISPVGCIRLDILDSEIYNISGTNPQAGIDFEVNNDDYPTENATVNNVYIHDTVGYNLIIPRAVKNIIITNCVFNRSVRIETGESVYLFNSKMKYLELDGKDGNTRYVSNCEILSSLYFGQSGVYELVIDGCVVGSDLTEEQPIVNTMERIEDVAGNCNVLIKNSELSAGSSTKMFSLGRKLQNVTLDSCILRSYYRRMEISAVSKFKMVDCDILEACYCFDIIAPSVEMINNRFDAVMQSALYGQVVALETATNIYFINNSLSGAKVETQFIKANYGMNPSGVISNNIIPQYANVGLMDSGNTLKIVNNVLSGTAND